MIKDDYPPLMTPETVAKIIHQHPNTVRRKCASGEIPAQKFQGAWLISRDALFAELERKEEETCREMKSAPVR